jgi:hypothetical protein
MNVRIQYDTEFLAGTYTGRRLALNSYHVVMQLVTGTENKTELNIAMERLKCFVNAILFDTVFINQIHNDHAGLMQIMGMNVTTLPDEPVDQIIGMMLYCKLNAIMEGRVMVSSVDISSHSSCGVWYLHDEQENVGIFDQPGWWNHPGILNHNIEIRSDEQEKIVKVQPNSWSEFDLAWPDESGEVIGNSVVYANFGRNEDQPVQ